MKKYVKLRCANFTLDNFSINEIYDGEIDDNGTITAIDANGKDHYFEEWWDDFYVLY